MKYIGLELHDKIYKSLVIKFPLLDKEVIEKIIRSQWKLLTGVMSEGKDEQVRIQGLGVFKVKKRRRQHWNEYNERKRIRESNQNSDNGGQLNSNGDNSSQISNSTSNSISI